MPALIPCPFCSTPNRVDLSRLAQGPTCGECRRPLLLDRPIGVSDELFDRVVRGADVPVLVDFYADWCGPCRMMAPALDEFAAVHAGRVLVLKHDTDRHPLTPRQFGVRGIPTQIAFRNGEEVGRHVGIASRDELAALSGLPPAAP